MIQAAAPLILASSVGLEAAPNIEAGGSGRRRFRQVAYTGGPMVVPGYQYPVVLDLAGGRITPKRAILLEHDKKKIIAQSDSVEIVAGEGVVISGFMLDTPDSQYVTDLADQGFEWQASVGVKPLSAPTLIRAGMRAEINGQEIEGPVIHVKLWQLGESSFVIAGADPETQSKVEQPIAASGSGYGNGWFIGGVPANQLPRIHATNNVTSEDAIVCSLLRSINCGSQTEKTFDDKTNSQADKMAGITIHGVFARYMAATGESPIYEREPLYRKVCELQNIQASSQSTISLPRVFANTLNKAIVAQMSLMPSVWRKFVKQDSASDFRPKTFIRLSGTSGFQRVNEEGELKHFTLVDSQYQAKLDTFGSVLGLSRKQLVNDDVGAFAQLPEIFGRAAELAIEQEAWTVLLAWFNASQTIDPASAPSMPPSGHPLNPLASVALGPTNMGALQWALQRFRDQLTPQGSPIMAVPEMLFVPTSLEVPALQCMSAISATRSQDVNVMANRFSVEVSPFLNNPNIAGNSQRNWYLFANPLVLAAIIGVFLNGQTSPTFESSEIDFNIVGGMRWRGYWDYGFAGAERQGAMRVTPA